MRSLSKRNEDKLHHSCTRVLLARHGRHLLTVEQISEQSLRHCFIQNFPVHSEQFVQHLRTIYQPTEVSEDYRQS